MLNDIKINPSNEKNLKEVINQLNTTSAFKFEIINNDNIVISPKKENNNLLIQGKVLAEKDDPLFGAYIKIPNQKSYTTTKLDGSFKLFGKLNSTDSLEISFIGFKTQKIALSEINDGEFGDFQLKISSKLMDEYSVIAYTTSGIIYNKEDQSIEITPENAGLLPGETETETDIYNSLQYLPGVNSPNGKAGNLTMRGTDPDKTLITFDNIPIYHTGHYLGTFSPFNTQMIGNVKIQRNGSHGSERGGRVGGLIEITSKSNILDSAKYNIGAATSYFSGNFSMPIIKNKLGLIIGGRSSYPTNWNSPKIESINEFIYQKSSVGAVLNGVEDFELLSYEYSFNDLNAKAVYQIHKNHQVNLSLLSINNNLNYNIFFHPESNDNRDSVLLNNWGANLSFINKWSNNLSSTTNFTNSYYRQKLSRTIRDTDSDINSISTYLNQTSDTKIKTNFHLKIKNKRSIDFGYQMDHHDLSFKYLSYTAAIAGSPPPPPGSPGPPPTPASPEIISLIDEPTSSYIHTLFANYSILNFDKLITLNAGIRASYYTPTKKTYPEPRLLINLHPSNSITVKTNLGVYHQFINHVAGKRVSPIGGVEAPFWQLSNNTNIKVVSGEQVMFGAIYSKNNLVFDVETYYKIINNVTTNNFIEFASDEEFIYGNYKNYGIDLLLKKSYKNLEGWLNYSYSQSNAKFDTLSFNYLWNQSHIFSAVLTYKWKKLKFSAGWNYKTGLAVADGIRIRYFNGAPVNAGTNTTPTGNTTQPDPVFTEDSPEGYTDFFPDNHQLDLSVAYSVIPKTKKWNLTFGVGIQNLYDNRSIFSQSLKSAGPDYPQGYAIREHKYGLGFTPSAMLNFSW